ncbi:MAG TPA: mannose-6-phosphate isomerase, class I [Beutenbergiaceae bacterium]|nr:mannose-6-phosphate isomerase, class I [Beutenbergiaceae bacterium]
MFIRLRGSEQHYAWGSTTAIPELLGRQPNGQPLAELWFGAHPSAPSVLPDEQGTTLREYLLTESRERLGGPVLARFGQYLPYLLKLIAPAQPLSLQVHPNLEQAKAGFAREEAAGIARDAAERLYKDPNHKPELLYALTEFTALCGFRTPRRALELLGSLKTTLTDRLAAILTADPTAGGMREAVTLLLTPGQVTPEEIEAVAQACAERRGARGGSVRIDRIVAQLAKAYPGDPGAVAALLLNPVTLYPGEAMFVPAGFPHAYLEGLGVELMANSDNTLRAGLTAKHVDPAGVLEILDCVAAPPMRIAPEVFERTRVFYAPVEDFELSVTTVTPDSGLAYLSGHGPRIVLTVAGQVQVRTRECEPEPLAQGEAVFVPADAGPVIADGEGEVVQAAVP